MRRGLNMWYARHNLRWNKHAHASVGQAGFYFALTGLEENIGGHYTQGVALGWFILPLQGGRWTNTDEHGRAKDVNMSVDAGETGVVQLL